MLSPVIAFCSIPLYTSCAPAFERCVAYSTVYGAQCGATGCFPKKFKTKSGPVTCARKHMEAFYEECMDDFLKCAFSCGFYVTYAAHRCSTGLCSNLCCSDQDKVCCGFSCTNSKTGTTYTLTETHFKIPGCPTATFDEHDVNCIYTSSTPGPCPGSN